MVDLAPAPATASGSPAPGGRSKRAGALRRLLANGAWYLLAIVILLVAWLLVGALASTPDYLLPSPRQTAIAMADNREVLLTESATTVREIVVGFAASVVVGVLIAIPVAFVPWVERLVYPMLVMGQAVPKIALGPIFVVWFGFGASTNVLIVISVAVFPVIINTALGLSSVERDLPRLGNSMGASRWRLFWRIRLPIALPSFFAGLKVAITLAVIGAVVGEFIAGSGGLGYVTLAASGRQNMALVFACVIGLAVIGIVAFAIIQAVERAALWWHPSHQAESR